MGLQSSRIIWGRDRMPGANAPQPVGLYDPNGTIYVGGNYAIHSDGSGEVAEDYHLYLCGAAETGSKWNAEDWKLQKGVRNWYLVDFKNFKKGARVIKEDTNGDFETIKLYRCKNGMSTPNVWKDVEWEVVYQDVGVAYQARDHKEVYYNGYWHKMMYYLPPAYDYADEFDPQVTYYKGDRCMIGETKYEYRGKEPYQGTWAERNPADWIVIDERISEEIMMFDENRQYHYQDYVIRIKPGLAQTKALYQYINRTPRSGSWNPAYWDEVEGVSKYETYRAYAKDERCIKMQIEIWDCRIVEFQSNISYNTGKHCIRYIDKQRIDPDILNWTAQTLYNGGDRCAHDGGIYQFNVTLPAPVAGPWNPANWDYLRPTYPDDIRARILEDEQLFGLYRSKRPVNGLWNDEDWDLIINELVTVKGHIYNTARLPIYEFQLAKNYVEGELCIWKTSFEDSELGLSVAKQDINNASYTQAPPYENYWQSLNEINETPDSYYIYKAKNAISAEDNSHFQRDNWLIVEQKVLPDDGDYGVIWEKLGNRGGMGGAPFGYAFATMGAIEWSHSNDDITIRGRFATFYTTATTAVFKAESVYGFTTEYNLGDIGRKIKVSSSHTGFNHLKFFKNVAYGLPDWNWIVNLRDPWYHNWNDMSTNYMYIRMFDEWNLVELDDIFIMSNTFVPVNYGLEAFACKGGDVSKIYRMIFSPSSLMMHEEVNIAGQLMHDFNEYVNFNSDMGDAIFADANYVFIKLKYYGPMHFNIKDIEWASYSYTQGPQPYRVEECYILRSGGILSMYEEEKYLYEDTGGDFGVDYLRAPVVYTNKLKSLVTVFDIAVDTDHNYTDVEGVINNFGLSAVADAAATDGITITTYHDPEYPSITHYIFHNVKKRNIEFHYAQFVGFSSTAGDIYYMLTPHTIGYNNDDPQARPNRFRTDVVLQTWHGSAYTSEIIYEEEVMDSDSSGLELQSMSNGVGNILPIGKVGTHYYFVNSHKYWNISGSSSTYASGNYSKSGIWDFDISNKTLTKIRAFANKEQYDSGICINNIRYVGNGSVTIDDYWRRWGEDSRFKRVEKLNLKLVAEDTHREHEVWSYDKETYTITMHIPLTDKNLFANSSGCPCSQRFTGSIFLYDYIEVFDGHGIYVYIPYFNLSSPELMSMSSFFWMSCGKTQYQAESYGDFYGGSYSDKTSFEFPLVF